MKQLFNQLLGRATESAMVLLDITATGVKCLSMIRDLTWNE